MDSNERLTALKKAYADIILNTAKEAAARIMVSERKAVRYQHELNVAKEEALQTLLRLKQMMDSKIREAEMTSLSQQSKIDELEAQLQEAEDIVKDLREELREVQAELERVTNDRQQLSDELGTTRQEGISDERKPNNSQFVVLSPPELQYNPIAVSEMGNFTFGQRNEGHNCCSVNGSCMGNSYVGHHDLPSIITRRKEHELYRNGCTQRIRAFEGNMLDEESYISREIHDVKNDTGVREDGQGEGICSSPTHKADNVCSIEKNLVDADNNWYRVQAEKSLPSKRKRATRCKIDRTPSRRYLPEQVLKRDETSDTSYSKTNSSSLNTNAQAGKGQMPPGLSSDTNEAGMQLKCAEVIESEVEFLKACSAQNKIDKDKALIDKLVLTRQDSGSLESSEIPVCGMDIEKVDAPLVHSESKPSEITNMISSQPRHDRIIRYTFQRRKKESSSSDGNASLEKNSLKRETEEKQNDSRGPKKSTSLTESSRDSRRLAQVARQLISLSEKKWR